MADLVMATKTNRQAIYSDFGGKEALFLSCLENYSKTIVSPAFEIVERENAGLDAVETFLETQISKAAAIGLPGPGCLMANTMTEIAPHNDDIKQHVADHNQRLQTGFRRVLETANQSKNKRDNSELDELAFFLTVSAQGLWSMSRVESDVDVLRAFVRTLMRLLKVELA